MIDVVLPCLNEAAAIGFVLSRMPDGYLPIVVDNGSTDATMHVARGCGAQVVHVAERASAPRWMAVSPRPRRPSCA